MSGARQSTASLPHGVAALGSGRRGSAAASVRARSRERLAGPDQPQSQRARQKDPRSTVVVRGCAGGASCGCTRQRYSFSQGVTGGRGGRYAGRAGVSDDVVEAQWRPFGGRRGMVVRKRERGGGACAVAAVAVMAAGSGLTGCSGSADAGPRGGPGQYGGAGGGAGRTGGRGRGARGAGRVGAGRHGAGQDVPGDGDRRHAAGHRGRRRLRLPHRAGPTAGRGAGAGRGLGRAQADHGAVHAGRALHEGPGRRRPRRQVGAHRHGGPGRRGNLVTGGATDPGAAAELLRAARDVAYVGPAEVGGVAVGHYRGTADLGEAAKAATPRMRGALAARRRASPRTRCRSTRTSTRRGGCGRCGTASVS